MEVFKTSKPSILRMTPHTMHITFSPVVERPTDSNSYKVKACPACGCWPQRKWVTAQCTALSVLAWAQRGLKTTTSKTKLTSFLHLMKLQILKKAVSGCSYFFPCLKGTESTKEEIPNMTSRGPSRQHNTLQCFYTESYTCL